MKKRHRMQQRQQKEIRNAIFKLNNNLRDDSGWQERFYVRQINSKFNNSTDTLSVKIRFYDKEMYLYEDQWFEYSSIFFLHDIWRTVNDFIVKNNFIKASDRRGYKVC